MIKYNDFGHNAIRTGNWLWQYAFVLGASKKYNEDFELPHYHLFNYLENKPKITTNQGYDVLFHFPHDGFCPQEVDEFFKENKGKVININLNPYAQSNRWFEHCHDYVFEMLKFKEEEINKIKEQYKDQLSKKTIGIGIRLGKDYTNSKDFVQIPNLWYIDSLNTYFPNWKEKYNVVVFSDNIELAKEIFKEYPFKYAEHNNTHVLKYTKEFFHNSEAAMNHLILGSLMDNFITPMSTFSVWQALLAQNRKGNTEGKIIHTGQNFSGNYLKTMKNLTIDYYPQNWIKHAI